MTHWQKKSHLANLRHPIATVSTLTRAFSFDARPREAADEASQLGTFDDAEFSEEAECEGESSEEEEEEDGDDDDGDDADESGGIELGAEERKEMIMNLRGEQTGSILDHRRQRANWWGIGSRSMWPPRLFRDGAPCRRTRLVQPQRRTNKFS